MPLTISAVHSTAVTMSSEKLPLLPKHKTVAEDSEPAMPLWKGVATLGASCGGVGILSMPVCMHHAGWALGTLITIAIGLLSDVSLCMIIRSAQLTGEFAFPDIGFQCYGVQGRSAVLAALMATLLGCALTVLLVVCQLSQVLPLARCLLSASAACG